MIAVAHRTGPEIGDIGAAARFGDGKRGDLLAREHRAGKAVLLLLRARMRDWRGGDAMAHQRGDQAAAARACKLFGQHDHVEEIGHLGATAGFRKADLQKTCVRCLAVQLAGQDASRFPTIDIGNNLSFQKPADLSAKVLMLGVVERTFVGYRHFQILVFQMPGRLRDAAAMR